MAPTSPVLPEELVAWEILVRLPAKMLLRCRAVCRSWCRLTSAADFLLAHHRRQPSLPLVTFFGSGRDFDAVDAFDLWGASAAAERHPILRFNSYDYCGTFTVHASCDGLLVLSGLSRNPFYIFNPATRQWTVLPKLIHCSVAALYHHSSSGEYRILCWKGNLSDAHYYILTVGTSLEPRYIGHFEATDRPPILLHNCLHWFLNVGRKSGLLVFDTILESLKCMSPPTTVNWCRAKVLEMDDMIGISCIRPNYTMLDLWVLQDYEMQVWSLKYQIELPVVELRSISKTKWFSAFIVSDYGDMLVVADGDSHLFYCDRKGKLLQQFHWDRVLPRPNGRWFKESLVQHAFLQRQDGVHVKQPRFFQGL